MSLLVIINNFHVRRTRRAIWPFEANAPLIVDPDAVLPVAIAVQGFEMVPGKSRKVAQRSCRLEAVELQARGALETGECLDALTGCKSARALVPVADDHERKFTRNYELRQA